MAISIIKNANDLVETKLNNIKFTYQYAYQIANLKAQCIKKLEDKSVHMVDQFLTNQIVFQNGPMEDNSLLKSKLDFILAPNDEVEMTNAVRDESSKILKMIENWSFNDL